MDLEGLDSFTLARVAQIEAKRRAVMQPMAPPPAPTPRGLQEADQGPSIPGGVGSRLERRTERGVEGWDLRSAVDVLVWYVTSWVDL